MIGTPMMQAQRNNGGGNNHRTNQTANHRNNSGNSTNNRNNNSRPGNSGNNNNNGRPNNNGNNNNNGRPNNNGNNNNNGRPNNNGNNNNNGRPNNNGGYNNNNGRPNNNGGYNNNNGRPNNNGGYHPGGNGYQGGGQRPNGGFKPGRPGTPLPGSYGHRPDMHRPIVVRPPRPAIRPYVPSFSSVLGITFGTMISNSIYALCNSGYTVSAYDSDNVYVQNVNMYGVTWPTGALYYNSTGLYSSQFEYVTNSNHQRIFNIASSNITARFGRPLSTERTSNGASSTWWGGDSQGYITLSYSMGYTSYGSIEGYTTLTIGN